MELGLRGKRALVLGSSRGLGLAIAQGLTAEGVAVTLCGRGHDVLAEEARKLSDSGAHADYLVLDLADPEQRRGALDRLLADGRGYDILINNGGGPAPGAVCAVETRQWQAAFDSMVCALFEVTASILPGMRERGWGRIINVVSSGVVQPIPNLGISNTLRASIMGWSKTLANEVAAEGVTVNSVIPGRIATARVGELDQAAAKRAGSTTEAIATASRSTIAVGRYGEPSEFADAVIFLASARASYITGTSLRVDGGLIRSI
ncbi:MULTISPECIES: SDR family oxidoreductase [unclassified Pseudomonas]|uniref:SDR family oxidoreductase n=1 Tax=unclassified Pseudomonas TaxID=196821 RepID=UPI0025F8EEBE|nr:MULTISPECIES: SDR family oxidoreductase [unclassified Pseudomonas]